MNDQEKHIETWKKIRDTLQTQLPLKAFALVAVDESGEVYWGGSFDATNDQKAQMIRWLKVLIHDANYLIKHPMP